MSYYTGQLRSRSLSGGCALYRPPGGRLTRLGLIARPLRPRSHTGLSGIAFATGVRAVGIPGPGSAVDLIGSGSSLDRALSCPYGLADGAAESRLFGSGHGSRCGY